MSGGDDLITTVARINITGHIAPYLPAVDRWFEVRGVLAPDLTVISSRTGKPTLNARFVEWMMGVDTGWVTDAKVSKNPSGHRSGCLSLLGDGVVPQQGAAAFRTILEAINGNG